MEHNKTTKLIDELKNKEQQTKLSYDIEKLKTKFQDEREKQIKELGYKQAYKLVEGNNELEIDLTTIEEIDTKYGTRYVINLLGDNSEFNLVVSPYLAGLILDEVSVVKSEVNILKFGSGIETKYKVFFIKEIK